MAFFSHKSRLLEAQIEASRKVTRKRVQIEPNEAFADIRAIRKAQIDADEVSTDSDGSVEYSKSTEEGSCIVFNGN